MGVQCEAADMPGCAVRLDNIRIRANDLAETVENILRKINGRGLCATAPKQPVLDPCLMDLIGNIEDRNSRIGELLHAILREI